MDFLLHVIIMCAYKQYMLFEINKAVKMIFAWKTTLNSLSVSNTALCPSFLHVSILALIKICLLARSY